MQRVERGRPKLARLLLLLSLGLGGTTAALAQLSLSFSVPGVSIGVNVPMYPRLVRVPGYPVYYAPQLQSNFFFYDGLYWIYEGDNWYASSWYNGPWALVGPDAVPLYVLRIPVRYYRRPPVYFGGWASDAPPRWGDHWGSRWEQQRDGWDRWNRRSAPAPAPLPAYQRRYPADHYPAPAQQPEIRGRNYRYQAHDPVVRQQFQTPAPRTAAPPRGQPQPRPQPEPQPRPQQPRPQPIPGHLPPQQPPHQPPPDRQHQQQLMPAQPMLQRPQPSGPQPPQPPQAPPRREQVPPQRDHQGGAAPPPTPAARGPAEPRQANPGRAAPERANPAPQDNPGRDGRQRKDDSGANGQAPDRGR